MDIIQRIWREFSACRDAQRVPSPELPPHRPFQCTHCNQHTMEQDDKMADVICVSCGVIQPYYRAPSAGFLPTTSCIIRKTIYKEQIYAERKLDELCGKTFVPSHVMDHVREQLDGEPLSVARMKRILFPQYKQRFIQIPIILHILDREHFHLIHLTGRQRQRVLQMMGKYFHAFHRIRGKKRRNNLNYHFVLQKLFQLLRLKYYPYTFQLPKLKATRDRHEKVWAQVCQVNQWPLQVTS